ncbi:hypothetical protein ACJVQT_23110 [Enterobacter huaxiensis]|uniref:hypothetical protein n=1 Tax=Enterobacter huaxiensis TaxID=2494702 RepID=UPI002175C35B|nr:hypothetical protein [Enterobacter huaxiensis]MCS5452557.1 hypothetical protein [Enterobacter huaxiensis]
MLKITTVEAAELIKLIANQARRQLANRQLLRTVKADAHYRLNRDLDGADDNGEVYAFVKMLDEARTKADADRVALDAEITATAYLDDFTAKRRADLTVKRAQEQGLTVTREDVMATETAKATQHYSVNAAVAELRTKKQNVTKITQKDDSAQHCNNHVWVLSKKPLSGNFDACSLATYITKRELIGRTPKGLRLKVGNNDSGSFFANDSYEFFFTEHEALEFLANEANKMADLLNERKLSMTRLLCDAHDAIRNIKDHK